MIKRVPSGVPNFLSKLNMVDIAQLVSASDCGSEGRGFESHYPPHEKTGTHLGACFFHGDLGIMGFERPLRKQSGGLFLGRGRIQGSVTAVRRTVGSDPSVFPQAFCGASRAILESPLRCFLPPSLRGAKRRGNPVDFFGGCSIVHGIATSGFALLAMTW